MEQSDLSTSQIRGATLEVGPNCHPSELPPRSQTTQKHRLQGSTEGEMSERQDRRNSHVSGLSPQVFWLAGSLLIISMASVVIPTIGWRWLIRIASIPGIILIMAFKVMLLKLPVFPLCWFTDLFSPQMYISC